MSFALYRLSKEMTDVSDLVPNVFLRKSPYPPFSKGGLGGFPGTPREPPDTLKRFEQSFAQML